MEKMEAEETVVEAGEKPKAKEEFSAEQIGRRLLRALTEGREDRVLKWMGWAGEKKIEKVLEGIEGPEKIVDLLGALVDSDGMWQRFAFSQCNIFLEKKRIFDSF